MAIQTLQDKGASCMVQSAYDGAVYRMFSDDCVIKGIGDEFEYNITDDLQITFYAGSEAIVGGNFFKIIADEVVNVSQTQGGNVNYICCTIDKSRANGQKGKIEALTTAEYLAIRDANINGNDTKRAFALYSYNTSMGHIDNLHRYGEVKEDGDRGCINDLLRRYAEYTVILDNKIKKNSIVSVFVQEYNIEIRDVKVSNGSITIYHEYLDHFVNILIKIEGEW